MRHPWILAIVAAGVAAQAAWAQTPRKSNVVIAARVLFPNDELSTPYNWGVGLGGGSEARLGRIVLLTGELGYSRFIGKNQEISGIDFEYRDLEIWQATIGVKLLARFVYAGAELGYDWYSLGRSDHVTLEDPNTDSDAAITPTVGIRVGRIDLSAQYRLGRKKWVAVQLGAIAW